VTYGSVHDNITCQCYVICYFIIFNL